MATDSTSNDTTASASLTRGWSERAARSGRTLSDAAKAPALFKPDFVRETQQEYRRAIAEATRWAGQA